MKNSILSVLTILFLYCSHKENNEKTILIGKETKNKDVIKDLDTLSFYMSEVHTRYKLALISNNTFLKKTTSWGCVGPTKVETHIFGTYSQNENVITLHPEKQIFYRWEENINGTPKSTHESTISSKEQKKYYVFESNNKTYLLPPVNKNTYRFEEFFNKLKNENPKDPVIVFLEADSIIFGKYGMDQLPDEHLKLFKKYYLK